MLACCYCLGLWGVGQPRGRVLVLVPAAAQGGSCTPLLASMARWMLRAVVLLQVRMLYLRWGAQEQGIAGHVWLVSPPLGAVTPVAASAPVPAALVPHRGQLWAPGSRAVAVVGGIDG